MDHTSSGNHLNGRLELRVLRRVQCMVLQLLFLLLRKLQLPVQRKARPYERNALSGKVFGRGDVDRAA